jgi:2-keto-4-pentenoate hydratase/2-oxohepta-3-ene-1,7-dioic acid hydratase in catechol pathway
MGVHVVHYRSQEGSAWGVVQGETVRPVPGQYDSLAQFLQEGSALARQMAKEAGAGTGFAVQDLQFLSPVTAPCRIVCQGANYGSHREESGLSGSRPPYNLIFTKADSALSGTHDDIICPPHVQLLDYEIELGLVIGKSITGPVQVTDENLHEYIAGLVIANDVSARDVQLLEMQWYKGKSYRTFCPVGPYLYLLDREDVMRIHDLELKLWVNGELRQAANTEQLLYKPAETLTELSGLMNFTPGDLLLTGTAGGVAMKIGKEDAELIFHPAMPHQEKIRTFVRRQKENPYLQGGDVIRCEIKSKDGTIDLGVLENRVIMQS